jgi:crossover junction endodeoxyribonuclease RuvC
VESGVQDFSKRRGESNGLMFLRFRKWLQEVMASFKSGELLVAYERAHFRGGAATEVCVGLQTRVQEVAEEMTAQYVPVTTSEVKKFATGKGNADKGQMIEMATGVLGRAPLDDNEADAVHIARWAASLYSLRRTNAEENA